jgi:hypothetical protein
MVGVNRRAPPGLVEDPVGNQIRQLSCGQLFSRPGPSEFLIPNHPLTSPVGSVSNPEASCGTHPRSFCRAKRRVSLRIILRSQRARRPQQLSSDPVSPNASLSINAEPAEPIQEAP